jgi:hypothetical protein
MSTEPSVEPQPILLDPSVLGTHRGIEWVQSLDESERERLLIPESFVRLREAVSASPLVEWFGLSEVETSEVFEIALSLKSFRANSTQSLPPEARQVASELRSMYPTPLGDVLLEEWTFLASNSIVLSRLKKPFTEFFRAGASLVQVVARRTLHLPAGSVLLPSHYRKAGVKWIALTGSAALAAVVPVLGPLQLAADAFFLLDP